MLFDWGVHLLDQILFLIPDKIKSVYCVMQYNKEGVDKQFRLSIGFESGKNAEIEVGTENFISPFRWLVLGDRGAVLLQDWTAKGKVVTAVETVVTFQPEIVYTAAGPTKTMAPRNHNTLLKETPDRVFPDEGAFYTKLYQALNGEEPYVKTEEVLRV